MGDVVKSIATGGMNSNAFKPKKPRFPEEETGRKVDEAAELARTKERERLRKGAGANSTRKSGTPTEALNAVIGKATLGGRV
jgi:hypothetical protein